MFEHFYPDELKRLVPGMCSGFEERQRHPARRAEPGERDCRVYPAAQRVVLRFLSRSLRFARRQVFCDGQHRTAFDFSYLSEVLREAGFQEVEKSAEGKSRLYGSSVPPYEPGDSMELPHSLCVEAFK
jgi:hypothetical protein